MGIDMQASTDPAFGEQTWMLIAGDKMSVKCVGVPLAETVTYRPPMERVYRAFEQYGAEANVGRRFPVAEPSF